jgi:hypothetical protein
MTFSKISRNYPLIMINLNEFSAQPGTFCMSYSFDNSKLINSIEKVGLLNNPYIIKRKDRTVEIVIGYRRILALKELSIKEVCCVDLTDSGLSDFELFILALHDNLFSRKVFTYIEKSMIISELNNIVKDINIIYDVCSLIGVSRKDYSVILKINKLDDKIKQVISNGVLHIKTIELLLQMETSDILLISYWLNKLKLSYNYQVQFIDYISDISRINKRSISSLMEEEFFQKLLADDKKNIPQKAKELIDYLRIRRNPNISKYQEIFEKKIKKLNLPSNVRVMNPAYFESEGYKLEIDFNNGEELQQILIKLADYKNKINGIKDPWMDDGL